MPFDALLASDSEMVPVGAIEVVREARAGPGELVHQLRSYLRDALHVAAVFRMQQPPGDPGARLPAVARHLRALAQHLSRDRELLVHDRRRALLAGELERRLPAGDRHLARYLLGELHRLGRAEIGRA